MPWVKVYLNSYHVYTMLDGESAADLIHSEIACQSGITVSKLLHPLVDIEGEWPFYAHKIAKPYILQIGPL